MIYYGKQNITQNDIDAVVEVLQSNFLTQGPKLVEFEDELKKYCNVKYVKAVSNATSALHIAYLAIGVGKGGRRHQGQYLHHQSHHKNSSKMMGHPDYQ